MQSRDLYQLLLFCGILTITTLSRLLELMKTNPHEIRIIFQGLFLTNENSNGIPIKEYMKTDPCNNDSNKTKLQYKSYRLNTKQ
uniref:Uncharacterized protein n=1 Tax=Onchocerca volvulus TaxID=6282 RepID=A0A8R1TVX3_ONCVO